MLHNTAKNKKKFIDNFAKNRFNVSQTSKSVGIHRQTVYGWIKSDPEFRQALEHAQEDMLDDLEDALLKRALGYDYVETKKSRKKIIKGEEETLTKTLTKTHVHLPPDVQAAKSILNARARHRGYGMKLDDSDQDDAGGDQIDGDGE